MKLKIVCITNLLLLFAFSSPAITIDDLVGTYVGKWTQYVAAVGEVQRFEAVVVFDADSRVTTFVGFREAGSSETSGIIPVAEDGSFVLSDGYGRGQLTLHGKHLHVFVEWGPDGDTVEFRGRLTDNLPDWLPPQD